MTESIYPDLECDRGWGRLQLVVPTFSYRDKKTKHVVAFLTYVLLKSSHTSIIALKYELTKRMIE